MNQPQKPTSNAAKGAGIVAALLASLAVWEGSKQVPYRDHIGVLTVCRGITGPDVIEGKRYSASECEALETKHIERMLARMDKCVTVPMKDGELLAYAHFTYNVGEAAFCRSTLVKKLNAGQHGAACNEMRKWTWAGGKDCRDPKNRCAGLPRRRDYETQMCLEGLQ
jgi:lysozyme